MRVRETVTGAFDVVNQRLTKTRTSCAGSWTTQNTFTTYTGQQRVKRIVDCVTPGFHSLRKKRQYLPPNPVTISDITTTRSAGSGDKNYNFSSPCYRAVDTGPSWADHTDASLIPAVDSDICSYVVVDAIAAMREGVFDALTNVAELRETLSMARFGWDRVMYYASKAARRAKYSRVRHDPKQVLGDFTSLWLEYRYGWRPACLAVDDALRALQAKLDKGALHFGRGRQVVSLNNSSNILSGGLTLANGLYSTTTVISGTRTYRGFSAGSITDSRAVWSNDPIATAWELVPFSFVADWFVNVGQWLRAVSPFNGVKELGFFASVHDSYTIESTTQINWSSSSQSGTYTGRSTKKQVDQYERMVDFDFPVPPPVWNPRLTPVRLLDLVSLVYQGRRSILRLLGS